MNEGADFTEKRIVHDIWALMLYILIVGATNTAMLLNIKNLELFVNQEFISVLFKLFAFNTLILLGLVFLTLIACIYIPSILIYASLILYPVLSVLAFIMFPNSTYLGICGLVISMIFFILFFNMIYRHIEYISLIMSKSTKILFSNILSIFVVFSFLNIFIMFQTIIMILASASSRSYLDALLLLVQAWNFYCTLYFYQVYISSIVVMDLTKEGVNISVTYYALRNTLYSSGSICFAALIVAIVAVMKHMINNMRERDERGSSNVILVMLISIMSFALGFFETIIKETNRIVFPYLAVHGTSYKESIHGAFIMISNRQSKGMAAFSVIDIVLWMLGIASFIILAIANIGFCYFTITNLLFRVLVILDFIILMYFSSLYSQILQMVSSAALTLIYTYISAPQAIETYDYQLKQAMDQKNSELKY
jgi:Plasma-membrane choline transporter